MTCLSHTLVNILLWPLLATLINQNDNQTETTWKLQLNEVTLKTFIKLK